MLFWTCDRNISEQINEVERTNREDSFLKKEET